MALPSPPCVAQVVALRPCLRGGGAAAAPPISEFQCCGAPAAAAAGKSGIRLRNVGNTYLSEL